ncbi:MAG: amino acid permease [Verrucomicrobia bacterium]|nr:amino acid permease [Verrucomicrobiota bacterium]
MADRGSTLPRPEAKFVRGLGLLDSTMMVAGSMIGSGIFIVSADIARQVGSAGWLLVVWLITGVLTLIAALSYGELAAMMPRAGGQYVYLREAYSPLAGFLYGWTFYLVIQTGTIAAVAVAFARFLGVLIPSVSETHKLFEFGRFALSPTTLVAIVVLTFLTGSNCTGLKTGKIVQNIFTLTKIAALVGLVLLGLLAGANATALNANFKDWWTATFTQPVARGANEFNATPLGGLQLWLVLGTAMVGSLFAADAWHSVTLTAAEVKNPKRNLPLSLGLGVSLVCLLYFLANVAYLVALPLKGSPNGTAALERGIQFALNDRVGTAAIEVVFGEKASVIMALLIMISTFGCINGLILTGARVYYAMARDGLFFGAIGRLNRQGVPQNALVVQCLWACVLTLSGTYSELLDYVIFAVLIFYVLTMAGLFRLRRIRPEAERPYRAFGYPLVPAIYIVAASLIALDLLFSAKTRDNTWPGLLIVLAGVPVYFFWKRIGSRTEDQTDELPENTEEAGPN